MTLESLLPWLLGLAGIWSIGTVAVAVWVALKLHYENSRLTHNETEHKRVETLLDKVRATPRAERDRL